MGKGAKMSGENGFSMNAFMRRMERGASHQEILRRECDLLEKDRLAHVRRLMRSRERKSQNIGGMYIHTYPELRVHNRMGMFVDGWVSHAGWYDGKCARHDSWRTEFLSPE